MKFALCCGFLFFWMASALPAQTLPDPAPKTWVRLYQKPNMDAVVHAYENGFAWDRRDQVGIVFGGHLGIYSGQIEHELVQICHTNQTWLYSHATNSYLTTRPLDRPQKRCGPKIYYDAGMNRAVIYGGAGTSFVDNDYYEIGTDGKSLIKDVKSGLAKARLPWAFDPTNKQWYFMRGLLEGLSDDDQWWGFQPNWIFVHEYGVAMIVPPVSGLVYFYSLYDNSWSLMNVANSAQGPSSAAAYMPTGYDRRHSKAVAVADSVTYIFDFWTRTWEKVIPSVRPMQHNQGWYFAYTTMTYDENNGRFVLLNDAGDSTWSFDPDAKQWTLEQTSGAPPSAGTMGEGMTYDPANRVALLYTNQSDQVWAYRNAAVDTPHVGEPGNVNAVTSADSVRVTWTRPSEGPAPDKYYIYRAVWLDHVNGYRPLDPSSYTLLDSTAGTYYSDAPTKAAKTFYTYTIQAMKGTEKGYFSSPAHSRRSAPMGLVVTVFNRHKVGLKWVADTAADAAGYNVYRKYGAIPRYGELQKINTALVGPSPVFQDSTVVLTNDTIVTYVVTTVNSYGQESGISPRADTRIDRVVGVWADTGSRIMSWHPTFSDTFAYYEVWGKLPGNYYTKPPVIRLATNIHDTFYNYPAGDIYHYKVRVVNAIGQEGHFSDVLPIADRYDDTLGFWKGDGMFEPPTWDPFWDRLGKSPAEIAVERRNSASGIRSAVLSITALPNPFSTKTRLRVTADLGAAFKEGPMVLALYNARGQRVARFDRTIAGALKCDFEWDASLFPAGIYFARVDAGNMRTNAKIILLR